MNEKIKKLAVQAKLPDYLLEYGTELCVAPHLERFAELIVKECADIVQTYMSRWPEDAELTKQIKEHFGVEA